MRSVSDALELLVPPFGDDGDWDDVLRRAGPERHRPRAAILALAATIAVVGGLAATPFGRAVVADTIDRFSAWVSGEPGEPASPEQQEAFEQRNAASYASFPTTTRLRLLLRADAAGKPFELLGFRTRASLCLRLVRVWLPGTGRPPECVPAAYLGQIEEPAFVVALARSQVGKPAQNVEGVYGFAADGVRAIEIERRSGTVRAAIANNVFLTLRARRAGSVADHPLPDPIVRIWALTDSGRVLLPFVSESLGEYGPDDVPVPSYFGGRALRPADVPGPAETERKPPAGRIGWVERRERRGQPIDLRAGLQHFGRVLFARAIQPDPEDPFRVAVSVIEPRRGPRPRGEKGPLVCAHEIRPLSRPPYGAACTALVPGRWRGQLLGFGYAGLQWTRVTTLAGDATARVEIFLSTGRRFEVPLRDNVLSFQVPFAELPGRIVAYDKAGRVIETTVVPGPAKLVPCPAPRFGEVRPPRPYERIDLGARTVNGRQILGKTLPQVVAALGEAARIQIVSRTEGQKHQWRIPFVRYGAPRSAYALGIGFGPRGDRLVAVSLHFQSPRVVDARLGHVLRMSPLELEQAIARAYGNRYRIRYEYGSIPSHGCQGMFAAKGIRRQLVFGLEPLRTRRPYLSITWQ